MDEATREKMTDIQVRYTDELLAKPNVVGIGIGLAKQCGEYTDQPAIIVMVVKKVPPQDLKEDEILPQALEGVRVDVQETGGFEAQ